MSEKTKENEEKKVVKTAEETPVSEVKKEEAVTEEKNEIVEEIKPAEKSEPEKKETKAEEAVTKGKNEVVEEAEPKEIQNASTLEFDWDSADDEDEYSKIERTELKDLYSKTLSTISEKEVLDGTVIALTEKDIVVNIGYKSDGVISKNEFRYNPDLKVGDSVEVYIESQEDKTGQLVLSHKKARTLRSWEKVNSSLENDEIINGFIKCRTKGGMIVDVFGIEAFLPGSQIDVKPIRDYDAFVGKTMEFKVVKINKEFKNVVVSHKALIEAELEEQKAKIIEQLEKGQVLEGTVKNITSYGVFIDLGGVDGLIHITDLSWGRVNHPEEVVELDQKLNVVILDFDESKKRIALGLKQLQEHPWDSLDTELKPGNKVKGKVVVIADYGAFIEIKPGVEGLIHVSEMSWSQHLRTAQDFFKIGDIVEAQILTLEREDRKMSLGIKQLKPDPWENILEKYPEGSKHTAKVKNFTNFGIFVELEEGVDGLIHISDLSWTKKIKHPAEFTEIDADIDVTVLEIDKDNRRLSLGHKQLEENPWDVFETLFGIDSDHEGTIVKIGNREALIAMPYGVEAICPVNHLKKEDGSMPAEEEKIIVKVIDFHKDAKKIVVSHLRTYKERSKTTKTKANYQSDIEKTTLGDISSLSELKDKLSNDSKKAIKKTTKKAEKPKVEKVKTEKPKTEEVKEKKTKAVKAKADKVKEEVEKEVKEEVKDKKTKTVKAKADKVKEEVKEEVKEKPKKKTTSKKKKEDESETKED
ncbi:MAG: 30S ribosomal protein S1 [Bacteroidetes bacterium]|nr:MAG: 30S ribosomal protein S1 [Bacteroidota bacterium]